MEDNDKRDSSVPSASSVSSGDGSSKENENEKEPGARRSEPDMFDAHEATLPRFTIDPGEAAPRQRTRTLLGVPTLVNDEERRLPVPPALNELPEPSPQPSGRLASAIFDSHEAAQTVREPGFENDGVIDITVDVDDHLDDVTMVSDADVVALPDNTGQLPPLRFDEALVAAPFASEAEPRTQPEPPYFVTAPQANSLSPREIIRGPSAPQPARDTSGRSGALLVAAVMLLATGAWFLTAGTFRRATLSTAAESSTAAATQPANNMADKKVEQPTLPAEKPTAPALAETVSAVPATPAPTTTARQAPIAEDNAARGLKPQKPALTASARGERVRRTSRASKANTTPAPTGELPQGPARAEVVTRLESVRSSVQACAAGRSGVADLDITISHTGVVMHVLVGGDFAGTTEGSCIARAVRQARFPQFKQERFRLLYPYAI